MAFKSHHGKFVVGESDGNANANSQSIGTCETFLIETMEYRTVSLKSCNGKYLVAGSSTSGYDITADSTLAEDDELFTVIRHQDGTVSFRSIYGRYIVAESDGRLRADRTWMRAWEKFTPICVNGKLFF